MRIAVLALQGAFIEHEEMLRKLGVETFEIRQVDDWQQQKDGLVIPGGESTTQLKLLKDLRLLDPIREAIERGLPVFGTCAGLILLAKKVIAEDFERISTMDITVCRNAYGRQTGSFYTEALVKQIDKKIPMTFIRAPYIQSVEGMTEVLATVDGHIVAAREGNQLVTAFHPELNKDLSMHRFFIEQLCEGK
ncbi:MAG: pyridoxal 5'-phosphate synthase glutaminase subunit PdxT [Prevotella sp.]|jgi:5'-phosphate synthase pdxT subunit|nr:pyridoxal 5'-phosphate synthase glutaminase subunit PdxT [Prevotella sp.]MCH3993592.1 pyridoxal 5'-phosphate synthase glutaminase subunit PdxT [Prevotella sp.]